MWLSLNNSAPSSSCSDDCNAVRTKSCEAQEDKFMANTVRADIYSFDVGSQRSKHRVTERAPDCCYDRQPFVIRVAAVGEQDADDASDRIGAYLSASVACSKRERAATARCASTCLCA